MLSACTAVVLLAGPVSAAAGAVSVGANAGANASLAVRTAPGKAQSAAHGGVPATAAPKPAVAAAAAAVAKPADVYARVTVAQLEPAGLYGDQEHFSPSSDQWQNAKTIVRVTKQRGMSPYAAVIAVAVAMQESSLHNVTAAVNADSLGLFQQRPSMGWGSAERLTDPAYATTAFLSALTQYAPDYGSMPLWQAAQNTQRSGYPTAYARWEDQAARMVQQIAAG